jgi:formyl-CoA transferase
VPTLGTPIKVDGRMEVDVVPPPGLGEHTDAVLGDVLKYPAGRIADLRRAGIVK